MNEEDEETSVLRDKRSHHHRTITLNTVIVSQPYYDEQKGKNIYQCMYLYCSFQLLFSDRLSLRVKYPTEQDAFINSLSSRQFGIKTLLQKRHALS